MRTPDEIKTALKYLSMTDIGEKLKLADDVAYAYQEEAVADAYAYIQRLEAELAATREALDRDGDLCRICKYDAETDDCSWVCKKCEVEGCPCRKCWETEAKEGFEWVGGQRNE